MGRWADGQTGRKEFPCPKFQGSWLAAQNDTLRHDIADEMVDWFNRADETYRTDLYRINDLNFARFEANVEQRFAESEAKVATKSDLRDLRDELMGALVNRRDELVGAWLGNVTSPTFAPS